MDVLAKNLGVSPDALANLPRNPNTERYIFNGRVPPPLAKDLVRGPAGEAMQMTWRLLGQEPIEVPGGRVRIVDSNNFKAATTIAAALVELDPGAMRELHWHPTNDEWQYYISGQAKMTVFASSGKARTFDYQAGDVGYVPFAMGHYILNTGQEPLRFLEMFRSDHYADVSLNQWLALTPPELVQAHLNIDDATTTAVTAYKGKSLIIQ
jgi:oxalate decarboxylase